MKCFNELLFNQWICLPICHRVISLHPMFSFFRTRHALRQHTARNHPWSNEQLLLILYYGKESDSHVNKDIIFRTRVSLRHHKAGSHRTMLCWSLPFIQFIIDEYFISEKYRITYGPENCIKLMIRLKKARVLTNSPFSIFVDDDGDDDGDDDDDDDGISNAGGNFLRWFWQRQGADGGDIADLEALILSTLGLIVPLGFHFWSCENISFLIF